MRRIAFVRFGAVLATSVLAMALVPAGPAAAATGSMPVYSDPVWWPLHMATKVDCTHSNKCPSGPHVAWGIDVIALEGATDTEYGPANFGVYAMGAGIVHIGDAHGEACGFGGATDFGTWVWIDHGGGVVSKYGHLAEIDVKEGQQVYVGTKLGVMGHTGDASSKYCTKLPYVDFQVRHGGITGPTVEFSTTDAPTRDGDLLVCTASGPQRMAEHAQARPDNAYGRSLPDDSNSYYRIDDLGAEWFLIGGTPGCAASPKAQRAPSGISLKASGKALATSWSKAPAGVNAVRVEFARDHPSTGWDNPRNEKWTDLGSGRTSTKFGSLHSKSKYRVRVWFHSAQGWSSPSGWVTAQAH